MIYIVTNVDNYKCIESIKMSRHFNSYVKIVDLNFVNDIFSKNVFIKKQYTDDEIYRCHTFLLFVNENEYINTVQLDRLIDYGIFDPYRKNMEDIIVCPQLFINNCECDIANYDINYRENILFNKSHSFIYSCYKLNEIFLSVGSKEFYNLLQNAPLLHKYIPLTNVKIENRINFLITSENNF